MRPGRELDTQIAKEIFGHEVWATNEELYERTPLGKRPLREYSSKMEYAWEVAEKARVTLVPVQGNRWFAFTAGGRSWSNPMQFVEYLQAGQFNDSGASEGENPALAICEAALISFEKKKALALAADSSESTQLPN